MPLQTITAFARRFGLSRATLLYYDRVGLLRPATVSPAGYRLYGDKEVRLMERIVTYRKAGLPLRSIQRILDEGTSDVLQAALERRLAALNEEIERLMAQQRLVIQLSGRAGGRLRQRGMGVAQWVSMLEEAGVDEAGRQRWHRAFERDAPDAHQVFLEFLGLGDQEITKIRRASRSHEAADGEHGERC